MTSWCPPPLWSGAIGPHAIRRGSPPRRSPDHLTAEPVAGLVTLREDSTAVTRAHASPHADSCQSGSGARSSPPGPPLPNLPMCRFEPDRIPAALMLDCCAGPRRPRPVRCAAWNERAAAVAPLAAVPNTGAACCCRDASSATRRGAVARVATIPPFGSRRQIDRAPDGENIVKAFRGARRRFSCGGGGQGVELAVISASSSLPPAARARRRRPGRLAGAGGSVQTRRDACTSRVLRCPSRQPAAVVPLARWIATPWRRSRARVTPWRASTGCSSAWRGWTAERRERDGACARRLTRPA